MQIIFGTDQANNLMERLTVLELDTFFQDGLQTPITAYAVLSAEDIPIVELPQMESMVSLHNNMLGEYRAKNWNYCVQALEHLRGKWAGSIDSFYDIFSERIKSLQEDKLPANWTGIILIEHDNDWDHGHLYSDAMEGQ